MKIKRNIIECLKCGDKIESCYTHDFKWCKCKSIFVDGGREYVRCGGDLNNMKCHTEYYDEDNI